jgi:CheY-like chemotaxis protein
VQVRGWLISAKRMTKLPGYTNSTSPRRLDNRVEATHFTGQLMTVLVVEDDENIRESLCDLLEEEGFAVVAAANGAEGLLWLRDHGQEVCTVLLDLMMPVMDGFEFLKLKDADPLLAAVPVIVVTAAGPIVEGSLRRKHRVHACLAKPLRIEDLLDAVGGCCRPERFN